MEIEEFKKCKAEMENSIAMEVSSLVAKFMEETGYSPNNIRINLVDVTTQGTVNVQYTVSSVETEVDI